MFGFKRRQDIEQELSNYRSARRDCVLVLLDEVPAETTTMSGIVVPTKAPQSFLHTATIISVGSEVDDLKKGDRVVISRAYGYDIPHAQSFVCKLKLVTPNQIEATVE